MTVDASSEELLRDVEDYLLRRGRFDLDEYYGMRGSEISELLGNYCEELSPGAQSRLVRLLSEVAVGQREQLSPHLHLAVHALGYLCLKGLRPSFVDSVSLLEREFNDQANIDIWTAAEEMVEPTGGLGFKRTWHYAAMLSLILNCLGSESAGKTKQYLLTHSTSQDFKTTLEQQSEVIKLISLPNPRST